MKRFSKVWLVALVVKTALAIWLPFSNDEAYYWVWGHHPQWSYFDHPPMVGWLFWLGTWIENIGNAARLPGVWLGHATLLIWHKILEPYLDESKQRLWLLFILVSPFFGGGSLIVTPDIPLVFFWSMSLLLLLRLLDQKSPLLYLALGAALGLGFCSKYMIVLFVPIALAWVFWSGRWRDVRWGFVPLTIVTGLLFCAPVLYWNWKHDWASFKFQLDHGLGSGSRYAMAPVEYVGGQIALLFPPIAWIAAQRREPKEARFLHFFGWLPLAFFFYTSFKSQVEANWPIMAHPAILALAFLNMRDWRWMKITMATWVLAHVLVFSEVVHHWIPVDPSKLKTNEFVRYDEFLEEARQPELLYLGSYQAAAAVSYKLRKQIYKAPGLNRPDFYDYVPHFPKDDTFKVIAEVSLQIPSWIPQRGYEVVEATRISNDYSRYRAKKRAESPSR